jgi:hypothetical protein
MTSRDVRFHLRVQRYGWDLATDVYAAEGAGPRAPRRPARRPGCGSRRPSLRWPDPSPPQCCRRTLCGARWRRPRAWPGCGRFEIRMTLVSAFRPGLQRPRVPR